MKQTYELFEVGGRVRDELLGLKSKDIDYTVVLADRTMSPKEGFDWFCSTIEDEGYRIFKKTPDMYTVRAKFPIEHTHSGTDADFVLARKEIGYVPGTRKPILELGSLEDDLVRRDFTLNALAKNVNGEIIDLFGGIKALNARILDTPLDPTETFLDDPLRVLRALRFSITKGFMIAPRVWAAIFIPAVLDKLEAVVSQERIREEVTKMLKADTVETLRLFQDLDQIETRIIEIIFKDGMWLMPTTKQ